MAAEHASRLDRGTPEKTEEPNASNKGLRYSDACLLLRKRNLLPGRRGSKKQAPYDLAPDISRAVWHDDPYLVDLNKEHVRQMYAARVNADYLEDVDLSDLDADDLKPFRWPSFIDRRPVGRVKPQTIHGDLVDLKTAIGKLVGETDRNGKKTSRRTRSKAWSWVTSKRTKRM